MSEVEYEQETDSVDELDEETSEFPNLYAEPGAILDPRYRTKSGRFAKSKSRKHDPRHRVRHRAKKHDPRRRHYRTHDPRRRVHHKRKMRLFDIAGASPFWSAILTPVSTAFGSIFHNYLYSRGMLKSAYPLPFVQANITQGGAIGGLLSVLLGYYGHGKTAPSLLSHVGAGMFAEGLNVPQIEGVTGMGTTGAGMGGKVAGLVVAEYMNAGPMGLHY